MNLTNEILIHKSGKVLDAAIRSALKKVSNAYLAETGQIGADLYDITTKTNVEACFAKFSILGVLKSDDLLNEDYIFLAMELYRVGIENWTESGIEQFFYTSIDVALKYKKSYGRRLRPGIGTFLVALHVQKIITLPSAFDWPANRKERSTSHRVLKHITAGSELIKLFASLARSEITKDAGSPFEYIVHSEKRFDWFRTYGMKLLLATGWLAPEDANEAELKEIQKTLPVKGIGKQVTLVLLHAFKDRCRLNIHSVRAISQKGPYLDLSLAPRVADPDKSADDVFALLTEIIKTSFARPDRFEKLDTVFRTETQWSNWIELQQAYIKRQRYETPKGPMAALAAFNLYMFFYLPKWFQENPETKLQFPDTPDKLIGGVYISRVIEPKEAVPRTFIEFLDERAKKLNQSDNAHYAQARNVQSFFNFITERSSELPNCSAFKQPIGKLDLPKTSGSIGTNKRPLPRRIFRHFVNYIECVRAYINVVIEKVVSYDAVDAHSYLLAHEIENRDLPWIDTFALASRVGFVPVMFTKNRTVPLRYLNYFSTCEWLRLKDGRLRCLPRPHAVNQILTALFTGLRHNHIQWLDGDLFDKHVNEDELEYAYLIVNTDKARKKPWSPFVNFRVIEILRSQRNWRNMIGEDGFKVKLKYNNNEDSAYPAFRPLFSYSKDGRPHSDNTYASAWKDLLSGFAGLLPELIEREGESVARLFKLRPPGIGFDDLDADQKLERYANEMEVCPLSVQTDITPHSTRVGVVSDLINYLPADLIGKNITGQTEGMVYHYVVIDPQLLKEDETRQAMIMRDRALKQQFEAELAMEPNRNSAFIKADAIVSNLARSMRVDVGESLIRYGCLSIAIHEDGLTGVDVLRAKGVDQAAFNKTEICPYGNNCPADVIKDLKGFRRCALCPYAVRSIDHLPAICAKKKQVAEEVAELNGRIVDGEDNGTYTPQELDEFEGERQRLCEELAGWSMCEAWLEHARKQIAEGVSQKKWLVAEPEALQRRLLRVELPSKTTEYLLSRLQECLAYPGMQSPLISKQLDLLRRKMLAQAGNLTEAFNMDVPVNAAAECAGVIRSLATAHGITAEQVYDLLTTEQHLMSIKTTPLLEVFYE